MNTLLASFLVAATLRGQSNATAPPPATAASQSERMLGERAMVDAANALLASLDDTSRAKVQRPFADPSRTQWSFVRGPRDGLFLSDMTAAQRDAVMALVATGLSGQGMERVRRIRIGEDLNRADEIERKVKELTYGADRYAVLVFGTPGDGAWGWRFEGHHIGLHFSSISGDTTTTPLFFGSFPATLRSGPEKGTRPLGAEQDVALELRRTFSEAQVKLATVGDAAPSDVITGPGHEAMLKSPEQQGGITMADLTTEQRDRLWGLVVRYANDLRGDLASEELRRIKDAGTERIRFGWAGEPALDKPHYFRIGGPTFVIEFDCTAGNPDHVHCVWNDPARNFGDPLAAHVRQEHPKPDR